MNVVKTPPSKKPPSSHTGKTISRVSEVIIHRCIWVKYGTNCYRALGPWIISPIALACCHCTQESREYTVGRLSAHRLVFALSQLPRVLFTRWIAPVSCFLERGGAQVTAPACTSCLFCHLQGTLPILNPPAAGVMLLPCCPAHPEGLLPSQSLYICAMALPLGNRASYEWGLGTDMNSFWRGIRREDWKIIFELKIKPKQQPFAALKTLWVPCNFYGFPVQPVTQTRNLASPLTTYFSAHSWIHS